jgi:hypothetical protein
VERFAFDEWPALTIAAEKLAVIGSVQFGDKAYMPSLLRVSQQGMRPAKLGEHSQMLLVSHLRNGETIWGTNPD